MKRYWMMNGLLTAIVLGTPVMAGQGTERLWAGQKLPVESAVFDAASYDGAKQELVLWFDNGAIYAYRDVPASTAALFVAAEKKGSFFHKHILGRFDSDCRQMAARRVKTGENTGTASKPVDTGSTQLTKGGV